MSEASRILFVRTDRMGDFLMNLPAIRLLRQDYPKASLCAAVSDSVSVLIEQHPDIDEILTIDPARIKQSFVYRCSVIRQMRRRRFEMVVVSNADKFWHLAALLSGARIRVGWKRKWPFCLTHALTDDKAVHLRHEIESNLRLVGLVCQTSWDGQIPLRIDPAATASVDAGFKRDRLESERIVAIHPGTSNPAKRWSPDNFARLIGAIQEKLPVKVILIGGPEEIRQSARLTDSIKEPPADWTGRLSLKELLAFLAYPRVEALISADSGPVHLAWMSQKPVVALYAQNVEGSNPARWGPRDSKSKVIYKPMQVITVEEVFQALCDCLKDQSGVA